MGCKFLQKTTEQVRCAFMCVHFVCSSGKLAVRNTSEPMGTRDAEAEGRADTKKTVKLTSELKPDPQQLQPVLRCLQRCSFRCFSACAKKWHKPECLTLKAAANAQMFKKGANSDASPHMNIVGTTSGVLPSAAAANTLAPLMAQSQHQPDSSRAADDHPQLSPTLLHCSLPRMVLLRGHQRLHSRWPHPRPYFPGASATVAW
eukprot:1156235-Pelagomonas_calceolata.AAC.2